MIINISMKMASASTKMSETKMAGDNINNGSGGDNMKLAASVMAYQASTYRVMAWWQRQHGSVMAK